MNSNPLISIVIANYNYGRFLSDALDSIISQNVGDDIEVVICDGGSSDNSVDVIRRYAGNLPPNTERSSFRSPPPPSTSTSLITWWCSENDGGQSSAFNKGFSHARGKYLTWLNADDAFTPGALSAIIREINRHPDCEWFVGSSVWCDAEMRIERCFCAHHFSTLRANFGGLNVSGPSSFFTKRLWERVGGVDESLHYVMDVDLWYKFYRQCGVRYRRTCHNVWAFRQHEASKMSGADTSKSARALENRRKSQLESALMNQLYNRRTGWRRRVIEFLTFSPMDRMIAHWRTLKFKGAKSCEQEI